MFTIDTTYPITLTPVFSKLPPSNTHSAAASLPSSNALPGTVQDYSHNKAFHPQTARWLGQKCTHHHQDAELHYNSESSFPLPEGFHTPSRQKYPEQEKP